MGRVSENAVGVVVPPLIACTSKMPLPVVSAPGPPTLLTCREEFPVALAPSITSLSDGELSAPRNVLNFIWLPGWNVALPPLIVKTLNGAPGGTRPAMSNVEPLPSVKSSTLTVPATPPCRIVPEDVVKVLGPAVPPASAAVAP